MQVLKIGTDNNYKVQVIDVIKNENLLLKIEGLDSLFATPLNYEWQVRREPAFVGGYQNWSTGELLQADSDSLTDNLNLSLTIPIINTLNLGDVFSLVLAVGYPNIEKKVISVVYKVNQSDFSSEQPLQGVLNVLSRGEVVLSSSQAVLANTTGLNIASLLNYDTTTAGLPNLSNRTLETFTRNGVVLSRSEYNWTSFGLFNKTDGLNFVGGELLTWQYIRL